MQVDEPRGHELAAGVEDAQRPLGRERRLERLDAAVADADVARAAQRLARIEHVAALDDEVELVARPHRALGSDEAARGGGEPEGCRSGEEVAT